MTYLYVGGMPSEDIGVWKLDPATFGAQQLQAVSGLRSPSFLCLHPTLPLLYAVERTWSAEESASGAVSVFRRDPASGELSQIHRCRSGGAFTAHVNVSADGRWLAVANPRGPNVALFGLDATGIPRGAPAIRQQAGRGATPRQESPWPHSVYFDRAAQRLYTCDLGLDRIFLYDIEPGSGQLLDAEQGFVQVNSGAGARHMAIDREQRGLYVVNELDSTVSVFRYDAEGRHLAIAQTLRTVPERSAKGNQPAEIVLSADGRHLYVTNRGHDSIAVFSVSGRSGHLSRRSNVPAQGNTPRHLILSRDGALAAVCNQASHEVVLFRTAPTGELLALDTRIAVRNPTCALLV